MIQKKICILGSYAVGKTSLVRRFVEDTFSPRYSTTIGVQIAKKACKIDDVEIDMMIWDIHGDDAFQTVSMSYLRGSSGLLFVVDGTRPETLDKVHLLRERALDAIGPVPSVLVINKSDLPLDSELDLTKLESEWSVLSTSAKSSDGVEDAFKLLGHHMLG